MGYRCRSRAIFHASFSIFHFDRGIEFEKKADQKMENEK